MSNIYIAIDPDVDKNGYCIYHKDTRKIEAGTMRLPILLKTFLDLPDKYCDEDKIFIIVEAAWYNKKSSWHVKVNDIETIVARKGFNVGQCVQRGKDICELALYASQLDPLRRIKLVTRMPLNKCWQGKDRKITHDELFAICQNIGIDYKKDRSCQEERDAVLLALVEANEPLVLKNFI